METVTCKYFTTVLGITKKDSETFEIQSGMTVEAFLDTLVEESSLQLSVIVQSAREGDTHKSYIVPHSPRHSRSPTSSGCESY